MWKNWGFFKKNIWHFQSIAITNTRQESSLYKTECYFEIPNVISEIPNVISEIPNMISEIPNVKCRHPNLA